MSDGAEVAKIIFIIVKIMIIFYLLVIGIKTHVNAKKKDIRVIVLLFIYLVVLILITVFELAEELIPMIFIIMNKDSQFNTPTKLKTII